METRRTLAALQGVAFRYAGQATDLLSDVTLTVQPGEVLMLAGPNGSGKSTVVALLSGRLAPSRGSVRVFGRDPFKTTRAPDLGLIAEPFHPEQSPLPVDFTVGRLLAWLGILDGISAEDARSLLDQLCLGTRFIRRRIRTLSKGERQRVVLLMVLLRQPRLILADEPLEGLDRESRRVVGEALRQYSQKAGRSVFWVSHHLSETLQYAHRLVEIDGQRLVEHPTKLFTFRITSCQGCSDEITASSLAVLPEVIEGILARSKKVCVDITNTKNAECTQ